MNQQSLSDATGCMQCGTEMKSTSGQFRCPSCGWGDRAGAD